MPNKKEPWCPDKEVRWSNIYFFIKNKTFSMNPFDKTSINEAKKLILLEAREASPSYKTFITAAIRALNLSEKTIKTILYKDIK